MPTSRLEAFSDGVFAIAATLLILNVSVAGGPLGPRLIEIWPSYVAYAVSRRRHRRRVRQSIRSATLYVAIAVFYVVESSIFGGRT